MKKYYLETFGCAMNEADSEKINMIMFQSGFLFVKDWKEADLIILNTCSVRQKGEDKVFGFLQEVGKLKARTPLNPPLLRGEIGHSSSINPPLSRGEMEQIPSLNPPLVRGEARNEQGGLFVLPVVAITGCMVRKTGLDSKYLIDYKRDRLNAKKISPLKNSLEIFNNDDKLFPRTKGKIDFVFRIEDIKYLPHILTNIFQERIGLEYKFDDYLKVKQLRENPASAIIVIQTGCDNYCSYCIVPYSRGIERSRDMKEIIEEAKEAVNNGAKEIVLVGQNVNSYGKQFVDKKFWNKEVGRWKEISGKSPFRQLLEELDKIEGLDRIRFTSSNPHDMTQDILDAHFELKKTCNHLHFALQSGNDEILKKMNRKHTCKNFKKMVKYLREKDSSFSISTDLIVGFSGETEEMFNDTLKVFDELEFDFSYNARYSVREGTIAAKMFPDDILEEVKSERWHKLNDKLLETLTKRNKMMLGKVEEILIAGKKNGYFYGRTRNFKEVFFKGENIKIGDLVNVLIEELDKYVLKGKLV